MLYPQIDFHNMDADALFAWIAAETAAGRIDPATLTGWHFDPPWRYENDGGGVLRGTAAAQYAGLPEPEIARHLAQAYTLAAPDAYALVWITFPKVYEFIRAQILRDLAVRLRGCLELSEVYELADALSAPEDRRFGPALRRYAQSIGGPWIPITGGAWGKWQIGNGFHYRGQAELWFLYKKGRMRPRMGAPTNFILTLDGAAAGPAGDLIMANIGEHSEKPPEALGRFLDMAAADGEAVVEPYGGQTASLIRAVLRTAAGLPNGRSVRYIGCEPDRERYETALARLRTETAYSFPLPASDDGATARQLSLFGTVAP
jgi:hypothetical protein